MRGIEYPKPARDELVSLYDNSASLRGIADKYGVSATVIRRWFRLYEIPRRSRAQATADANSLRPRGKGSRGGKSIHNESVRRTQRKRQEIVQRYRNERGCQECGEKHPATLDLHHRDPSTKHKSLRSYGHTEDRGGRIGGRGWKNVSLRDLPAELAKCDVLCSNCHRILEDEEKARAAM